MNETLQEFVDSRDVPMRVDRENAVIRGVKILGVESRNERTYLPEALSEAGPLYEETKVNVNHPKGNPLGVRDYRDRIGVLRGVAVRPAEGLFADFHFNPKHALAEQLVWDAEHMPENVGFSHNVQARTSRRGERVVVEAITKVQSVDLVADPATTRGLFESTAREAKADGANACPNGARRCLERLTVEELREHRPDLVETMIGETAVELSRLREEVDRLEAAEALLRKRILIRRLLLEHSLPEPDAVELRARSIVSERFLESLLAAPNESAMREMIRERAELVRGVIASGGEERTSGFRPTSRDQSQVYGAGPVDVKRFVESIT
ncbi:MAG: hypothetical protein ACYTG0_02895 [Planctomycetota bacterium]|jgi:hypothetical protein